MDTTYDILPTQHRRLYTYNVGGSAATTQEALSERSEQQTRLGYATQEVLHTKYWGLCRYSTGGSAHKTLGALPIQHSVLCLNNTPDFSIQHRKPCLVSFTIQSFYYWKRAQVAIDTRIRLEAEM
jgi:hypothetical protein